MRIHIKRLSRSASQREKRARRPVLREFFKRTGVFSNGQRDLLPQDPGSVLVLRAFVQYGLDSALKRVNAIGNFRNFICGDVDSEVDFGAVTPAWREFG